MIPHLFGILRREINFEAVFAGVAGARDHAMHAIHVAERKMIVTNRGERNFGEALQQMLSQRALNREQGIAIAVILHLGAVMIVGPNVGEVALLISGIHDEEIMALRDTVNQKIIDKSSRRRHQAGVLNLSIGQLRGIVASDVLDE